VSAVATYRRRDVDGSGLPTSARPLALPDLPGWFATIGMLGTIGGLSSWVTMKLDKTAVGRSPSDDWWRSPSLADRKEAGHAID
jgi:hypothetical protein